MNSEYSASYTTRPESKPVVLIMVCIYVFLVIERPWESIRYLNGLQIERAYAIILIVVAFVHRKFKIVASPTNRWIYGLLALHFVLAPFAYNYVYSFEQGIEYVKLVVLYLLMLSVANNEYALKMLAKAYVFSVMIYAIHSLLEYANGRHVWRMGISRMVGVDSTFSDPNTFGATIVLSIPVVYALLRIEASKKVRCLYYLYFAIAVICVVLTGSRTSFVALLSLSAIWILMQQGKRRVFILVAALMSMGIVWNVMPTEKQSRFRTLWDDEAGPANAKASADGRILGWKTSLKMFKQHPLTGIGAGGKNFIGYRMSHYIEDGEQASNQAHNLYGEVLAEFGIIGAFLFVRLIFSIWNCCKLARSHLLLKYGNESFLYHLAGAIIVTLILLLIFGIGGHNFYRPLWLWLAAWSSSIYLILYSHDVNMQRI